MHDSSFQLNRRPFMAAPQLEFYFPAQSIETARQTLTSSIQRGAGPGLVIGPAGTGKTLLCHKLASQFRPMAAVAVLSKTHLCTRRALLQLILFELGLPYRGMDEGEVRLSLIDHLTSKDRYPLGMVLLVDEAHCLTFRLLEEIRMLSNLVHDGQNRVHVVLAGNSSLEERFASPKLEGFNQRVVARAYLQAMNREETLGYIQSQVALAGGNALDLFSEPAVDAVYQATGGVPRLINQVCEHALTLAAAEGLSKLEAVGIEEAWADLQQLPVPTSPKTTSETESQSDVVEFGSLQDDVFVDDEPKEGWLDEAHPPAPNEPHVHPIEDTTSFPIVDQDRQLYRTERRLEEIQRQVEQVNREWDDAPPATADDFQTPVVEAPPAQTPQVDAPVLEEPGVEATKTEEPVLEEPVLEEPVLEEPVLEEPVLEEPSVEATKIEEPEIEAPESEEPEFDSSGALSPLPTGDNPPQAYDPFSEPFDEEEVVLVDRCTLNDLPAPPWPATPLAGIAEPSGRELGAGSVSIEDARESVEGARQEPEDIGTKTVIDAFQFGAQSHIIDDELSPTENPEELVSDYLILAPEAIELPLLSEENDGEHPAETTMEDVPETSRQEDGREDPQAASMPDDGVFNEEDSALKGQDAFAHDIENAEKLNELDRLPAVDFSSEIPDATQLVASS